jgi:hypothetical protein
MKSLKEHPLFTLWLVILTILLAISFIKVKVQVTITSNEPAKVSVDKDVHFNMGSWQYE